jgi:hypothetical protein
MTTPRSIGDLIESLDPNDLVISPALAHYATESPRPSTLATDAPSNEQLVEATQRFYAEHQKILDAATHNTATVAQSRPDYVRTMNDFDWKSEQLSNAEKNVTGRSIFGTDGGGLWGPTIDNLKADDLFTTIGVGVSADLQVGIGGAGGIGAAWDMVKNRGVPRGYVYAIGEAGLRIATSVNVQCVVFNRLPADLNATVYGLKASIDLGISVTLHVVYTNLGSLTKLGFAVGAGVGFGLGAGATVFGGHIWNFG